MNEKLLHMNTSENKIAFMSKQLYSCVFSPQKGKWSLGAAERCVSCTEATLIVKGIWGSSKKPEKNHPTLLRLSTLRILDQCPHITHSILLVPTQPL